MLFLLIGLTGYVVFNHFVTQTELVNSACEGSNYSDNTSLVSINGERTWVNCSNLILIQSNEVAS